MAGSPDVLLERGSVLNAVEGLIGQTRSGSPGALFVVAEAGLGKTSLVDHACRLAAERGLATGLSRGNAMEDSLPFSLLAGAIRDLGAGRELLEGDGRGLAGSDARAAQFYAVLRWLESRGDEPALLALDDLHWADADSLALLAFLCRRLTSLSMVVLATLRPWPPAAQSVADELAQEGIASVERLVPLTREAAASLLRARADRDLAKGVVRQALDLCAGNPLLLEQVALAITRGEEVAQLAETGTTGAFEGLLLARFAGLPPAGLRCAQCAAVLGTGFRPDVAIRLANLDEAAADLALNALDRSRLVCPAAGSRVEFAHPLFRQALYDDLGASTRTRMHARAFAILVDRGLEDEAAEHAVHADLVGDKRAVAVLERVGRGARQAGAIATAIRHLKAAVHLAAGSANTGLVLALGEALLAGGSPAEAIPVYEGVLARPDASVAARVNALAMCGRALVLTGSHELARARFDEAIRVAEAEDTTAAAEVLLAAALASWLTAGPTRALALADRARGLTTSLDGLLRTTAEVARGFIALQSGDPTGVESSVEAIGGLPPDLGLTISEVGSAWGAVTNCAHALGLVERLDEADQLFTKARAAADRAGAPEAMAVLANGHAFILTRMGRLGEALAAIDVAISFLDLVPMIESFAGVGAAYILLHMGRLEESARWCSRIEAVATARGEWNALLFLWDVIGQRHLHEGRANDASQAFDRLANTVERMGIGEPCLPPWARHGINAHLVAGRIDYAERVIEWLERRGRELPCHFPRIAEATGRALLAERRGDRDTAEAAFGAAMVLHDQCELPLEKVETLLTYGAFLRRSGSLGRARPLLAEGIELAEVCGAAWLASQARDELRVAGGRRRRRLDHTGRLTAQEQRVAELAAQGATNPEIARQLYLSVSTVETHLEHVYAKLGIRSRRELMTASGRLGEAKE